MRWRFSTNRGDRRPTSWLDRLDFADVLLLAVPFLCLFPLRNNDLWWHLAAGRAIVEQRAFLHGDPFAFTKFMGDWVDNEWLSQLFFYATWRLAGNLGLVALRAALYTAVFVALRSLLRAGRQPSALLPCLVVGIALSYGWWGLRPSVVSLIGTLVLLRVLEEIRRAGRGFAVLPALFLVWSWAHPGFLFGLCLLIGTVAALYLEPLLPGPPRWSARARLPGRLALATAVSALATLANPYGWRVYTQQLAMIHNTAYRAVLDEWVPPSAPFLLLVILALGAFVLLRFRRVPLAGWVPIVGAAALATTGVRFVEYFALVAVPAMLVHLGRLRPVGRRQLFVFALMAGSVVVGLRPPLAVSMREGQPGGAVVDPVERRLEGRIDRNATLLVAVLGVAFAAAAVRGRRGPRWLLARGRGYARAPLWTGAVAAAALLAVAASRTGWLPADAVEPGRYPQGCLAALSRTGPRVFNRLSWGGWLTWKVGLPTFIDGRGWGQPIFFDYARCHGPEWRSVFDAYRLDAAIVRSDGELARSLARAPDWEPLCRDAVATVYARRDAGVPRAGTRRRP